MQFNRFPTYDEPLTTKGMTTRGWYSLWSGLVKGQPTGPTAGVTVGASPFIYTAPSGGSIVVNGGSTTQIAVSRDGANFFITGQVNGMFPLSQGDQVKVTYPVAVPTMTFIPQ
jgi:hypothetical protein